MVLKEVMNPVVMCTQRTMLFRFRQALLVLLFFIVLFGCFAAENENEISERIIAAPHKNVGRDVIDGTGVENASGFDDTNSVLGEMRVSHNRVSVSTVALFTLAMAAATGLGAVPFFFVELDPHWAGICNGMAAGVMLAASFDLIQEGQAHGASNWVVIGILAGGIFILFCKKVMALFFNFCMKFGHRLRFNTDMLQLGFCSVIYIVTSSQLKQTQYLFKCI